tara:strand:+ start:62 stop:502 length:441 start_codon:yes stop_codon:yes gene_type:complete
MIVLRGDKQEKNKYSLWTVESKKKESLLFTLDQWKTFNDKIIDFNNIGLLINSDQNIEFLEESLNLFSIIQINFLTFKDGRPFSIARNLRTKFSYNGELRASGYMLPDQYGYLMRCGFDTVEIPTKDKDIWINVLNLESREFYQPF